MSDASWGILGTVLTALIGMIGAVAITWIRAAYKWKNGQPHDADAAGPPGGP